MHCSRDVAREATNPSSFVTFMTAVNFTYTVASEGVDAEGITIKADSITNTGTWRTHNPIRNIDRSHAALNNQAGHKVDGSQGLEVVGVTLGSPVVGDTFERTGMIEATVTFHRAVTVTGTPRLALNIGSNTRQADYASGTGKTALKLRYTMAAGDIDERGSA